MFELISKLMVFVGIIIMAHGIYLCRNLIVSLDDKKSKELLRILFLLIVFFFVGYILYFVIMTTEMGARLGGDFLASAILFFGAVFVDLILRFSASIIRKLELAKENLESKKELLEKYQKKIAHKNLELEAKNKELDEVLEDFYTLRINLAKAEKGEEKKKIEEENEIIKQQLKTLKK